MKRIAAPRVLALGLALALLAACVRSDQAAAPSAARAPGPLPPGTHDTA